MCRMYWAWSSKELVAAALSLPGIEGWSGMLDSHSSSLALNWSVEPVTVSLRSLGMVLKSLAPLTCREDSLALFTAAGPVLLHQPNPPLMLSKGDIIPLHKSLSNFPKEDNLVPFPSSLLGVETKGLEPIPVVQVTHAINLGRP